MSKAYKLFLVGVTVVGVGLLGALGMKLSHADVLNPAGQIAQKELNLMVFALALMAVIVVPVFVMTFMISWKYREGNTKKKKYQPNWDGSRLYESIWWGFPLLIITVLSVVTWQSSHELDPHKPIASTTKPLTIQVVALQWKWLFIYPKESIASVNYVQFPADTPVTFEITSNGPMNSFWIPSLGGQIYAMSGMSTHLNLMADTSGSYKGSSANLSGDGFAGMTFTATSSSRSDFASWVDKVRATGKTLDSSTYDTLAVPSKNNPVVSYESVENNLYTIIMNKDLKPEMMDRASEHMSGDMH